MDIELQDTEFANAFGYSSGKGSSDVVIGDLEFIGFKKNPKYPAPADIFYPKGSKKKYRLVDDEPFDQITQFAFYRKIGEAISAGAFMAYPEKDANVGNDIGYQSGINLKQAMSYASKIGANAFYNAGDQYFFKAIKPGTTLLQNAPGGTLYSRYKF